MSILHHSRWFTVSEAHSNFLLVMHMKILSISLPSSAVVWTDAFQFVLMIGAVFAVIFMGILNLDRPTDLFSIADEGGRLILFE